MASLDDQLCDALRAHLKRTGLSGRRFGAHVLGDPGFVASLMKGRRTGLATADRVLGAMGLAPIALAFRREVEAFLRVTGTKVYVLGEAAAGDPSFVGRLRRGASFRLATVERVRDWMRDAAGEAGLGAMRRAVADAPFLDAGPGAAPGGANHQTTDEGENGMDHDGNAYLSTRKAAAFLGLSPRTMDRNRMRGEGPSYYRFGQRVLYRREDLEEWAEARRVALGAAAAGRGGPNGAGDGRRAP